MGRVRQTKVRYISLYLNYKVYFYFAGESRPGHKYYLEGLDQLTMFADYRVPQILRLAQRFFGDNSFGLIMSLMFLELWELCVIVTLWRL